MWLHYYGVLRRKLMGERGVGTLEIVLIIFVLVGFVILFREKMLELITTYLNKMDPKL